jgi:hypothetical protein
MILIAGGIYVVVTFGAPLMTEPAHPRSASPDSHTASFAAAPGAADLQGQSLDDRTGALVDPITGAVLNGHVRIAAPEPPGVSLDVVNLDAVSLGTVRVPGLAATPVDLGISSWPASLSASSPRTVVHPLSTAAELRGGSPVVYEAGTPSAKAKPAFRILCDACPGVHYAMNYVLHRHGTLAEYSSREAIILDALEIGAIAASGGGRVNLAEWNF